IASAPALLRALAHDAEPLVRGHAAWAVGQIARGMDGARRAGGARHAGEAPRPDPARAAGPPRSQLIAALEAAAGDADAFVSEEAAAALASLEQGEAFAAEAET